MPQLLSLLTPGPIDVSLQDIRCLVCVCMPACACMRVCGCECMRVYAHAHMRTRADGVAPLCASTNSSPTHRAVCLHLLCTCMCARAHVCMHFCVLVHNLVHLRARWFLLRVYVRACLHYMAVSASVRASIVTNDFRRFGAELWSSQPAGHQQVDFKNEEWRSCSIKLHVAGMQQ